MDLIRGEAAKHFCQLKQRGRTRAPISVQIVTVSEYAHAAGQGGAVKSGQADAERARILFQAEMELKSGEYSQVATDEKTPPVKVERAGGWSWKGERIHFDRVSHSIKMLWCFKWKCV